MDIHDNARTTRHSRMLMVQRLASGWTVATVAAAQGVSPRTVRKWRDRYTAEGEAGLADRSSRPRRSPRRLAAPSEAEIIALRRDRLSGPPLPAVSAVPSPRSEPCCAASASAGCRRSTPRPECPLRARHSRAN